MQAAASDRTSTWAPGFPAAEPHFFGIEWNAENQLTRVLQNAAEVARFKYDPKGRRVERVAGGTTTLWAYEGQDVLRETVAGGAVKYVHGPNIDEALAQEDGAGALSHIHADGLGSVVRTSSAAGAVISSRRYDAFGNLEVGAANGYAFTGREWDGAAGLYYYRARYYNPQIGRFISEDPIGFKAGPNFYAYVNNDPVRHVDPLGLIGDPYSTGCTVTFGAYAYRQGKRWGWPYAHCIASCLIGRYCGQAPGYVVGEVKEYWDFAWCKAGRRDSCDSAFQPSDYEDNFRGATCPIQMTCEQACENRKNQNPPPGPYGGQGSW